MNRLSTTTLRLAAGMVAAALLPVGAGVVAGALPATASPPPELVLTGTLTGPGFSPVAATMVFATINDVDEHPKTSQPIEHHSLGQPAWVSPGGHFYLSVPPAPALVSYATTHRGWANLFVHVLSANGISAIVNVPIKRTADGGFAVTHIDPTLGSTVDIRLPAPVPGQHPMSAPVAAPTALPTVPASPPVPLPLASPPGNAGATWLPTWNPVIPTYTDCLDRSVDVAKQDQPTTVNEWHAYVNQPNFYDGTDFHSSVVTDSYSAYAQTEIDVGYSYDGTDWTIKSTSSFMNRDTNTLTVSSDPGYSGGEEFRPRFTYTKSAHSPYCSLLGGTSGGYTVQASGCCAGEAPGIDKSSLDGPFQYANHNVSPPGSPLGTPPNIFTHRENSTDDKVTGTTDRYALAANAFGFEVGVTGEFSNSSTLHWDFQNTKTLPRDHFGPYRTLFMLWDTHFAPNMAAATQIAAYTLRYEGDPGNPTPLPTTPECYGDLCTPPGGL